MSDLALPLSRNRKWPGPRRSLGPATALPSVSDTASLRRSAALLSLSAVVVGFANYAYSLSVAWLLPVGAYAVFATGQALLLIGGTVAASSAPWVLSREIAGAPDDADVRRRAVAFALVLSTGQAAVAAVVGAAVTSRFAGPGTVAVVAVALFVAFESAAAVGYLQGLQRFGLILGTRLAEVATKVAAGVALVAAGAGAGGALGGFVAGSVVVAAVGLAVARHDLSFPSGLGGFRSLAVQAAGLAAIQGAVALIVGLDVILASVTHADDGRLAAYQVAGTLTRVPLFLSVALSMVVFPKLVGRRSRPVAEVAGPSLDALVRTVVPVAIVLATVPPSLLQATLPAGYAAVGRFLVPTAALGVLVAVVNLLTTFFQAERRVTACLAVMGLAVVVHAASVLAGLRLAGLDGMASGAVAGAGAAVVMMVALAHRTWPGVVSVQPAALWGVVAAAGLVPLRALPLMWAAAAAGVLAFAAWTGLLRSRVGDHETVLAGASPAAPAAARVAAVDVLPAAVPAAGAAAPVPAVVAVPRAAAPSGPAPGRLRILHLAFEDHRRPGSGGGAIRTREMNRRLACDHDITVVTARFKGCEDRVEDGVRYVHIGVAAGYFASILAYFASVPMALRRHPSDLVVEDFAAPFSTMGVPLLTRRPVVGMVQWLFAKEKSRQYKLPFFAVEALGLRSHRNLVAVSADLADELRRRNPRAVVDVVHNGVEPELFDIDVERTRDLVFLGRIEIEQKGLDLLLRAYAEVEPLVPGRLVLAGDGPDTEAVRKVIAALGLADRVVLAGRVSGAAKHRLLASAQLVCMPSRFETFGMVAAEAMATGTPVLAFAIPCLAEVLPAHCGVMVPTFDVAAYAKAMAELAADSERCARMGSTGRDVARKFDWDALSSRQAAAYRRAVAPPSPASAAVLGPLVERLGRSGRKPRLLLFGNYGNGNLGDEAILSRLGEVLSGHAAVTVVARRPEKVQALHGLAAVRTVSLAGLWAFARADVVAIGGGGIFGRGIPPLPSVLPLVALAGRLLGKRTAYLAIGAYDGMPGPVRRVLRLSARVASLVTVRDLESQRNMGFGRRLLPLLVLDPGLELTAAPRDVATGLLRDAGVRLDPAPLAVSMKPTADAALDEAAMAAVSAAVDEWCAHSQGDVVFVALSGRGDYGLGEGATDAGLAAQLRSRIRQPERLRLVGPDLHPAQIKAVIGMADSLVGMRLHAQIFAHATGRPLLGLSFERKADAFLDEAKADRVALAGLEPQVVTDWVRARCRR